MDAIRTKHMEPQIDREHISLELLRDFEAELRDALNSLGGREVYGLLERFPFLAALHIHAAIEGYILLRASGRLKASKLLIRPALEAMIRIRAAHAKPELMFRIVLTEVEEDKIWIRSLNRPSEVIEAIEKDWLAFKAAYATKYPRHSVNEHKPSKPNKPKQPNTLSLKEAAAAFGMESYYNTHYRLYCRFTHASLQAMVGELDEFESEDNSTMALCAGTAIEALVSIGANAPNLNELIERRAGLSLPTARKDSHLH